MRRWLFLLGFSIGTWLITQIDVAWIAPWPIAIFNISLLLVIITTLFLGPGLGLWAAVATGWLQDQFSVLPPSTHLVAMVATVLMVWLIIRRVVATRSLISFLLAVIAGTATYYFWQAGWIRLWQVFEPASLHPNWRQWLTVLAWQVVIHPSLAYCFWLLFGRHRYGQTNLSRPF